MTDTAVGNRVDQYTIVISFSYENNCCLVAGVIVRSTVLLHCSVTDNHVYENMENISCRNTFALMSPHNGGIMITATMAVGLSVCFVLHIYC